MDTPIGEEIAHAVENFSDLSVPSIIMYEVYKKLAAEKNDDYAMEVINYMQSGTVITLDSGLSIFAAKISNKHKLPMADSIIYAASIQNSAVLWTTDKHFRDLPGVNYFPKPAD